MSTNPILDTLEQQLTPATIEQMSSSLGTDPATTRNAIFTALPALLGGLARNASNPSGAASLDRALDDHDGGILDNLGGLLGGSASSIGGAILGHIFGARRAPVEQGVARSTGLDGAQVAKLLTMLAPLIMGVLGRMKRKNGIDASQLPDVLHRSATQLEKDTPGAGSLTAILDANRDGNIADDVARIGGSALAGVLNRS